MRDYIITSSSTADLDKKFFEENNIKFAKFHYEVDRVEYLDDLGQSLSPEEFYSKIKKGADTRTSLVNELEYKEFFEPILKEGKDIIHIELSSGISGSFNSARNAANELNKKYNHKVVVIDSLAASSGLGLLLDTAVEMKKEGKTFQEVINFLEDNKLNLHHWFFSTNLERYFKGGRISRASFVLGSLLNIYPLLNVSNEGKLVVRKKLHGMKSVRKEVMNCILSNIENGLDYDKKIFICHSDFLEEATNLANTIENTYPKMKGKVLINNIGTTIGSHTGIGTIAVFFYGKKREN